MKISKKLFFICLCVGFCMGLVLGGAIGYYHYFT